MSDNFDSGDNVSPYSEFGQEFELESDPLADFEEGLQEADKCPIRVYIEHEVYNEPNVETTIRQKANRILEWKEFMEPFDRYPACPNTNHVQLFIDKELDVGNSKPTILKKLRALANMFDHWSTIGHMPHGTGKAAGFNPFEKAKVLKMDELNERGKNKQKARHDISVEKIGHKLRSVKNTLNRTFLTTQFKYGTRAGQTANVKLSDVQLDHEGLNELYPELGSNPWVKKFEGDLIYFPSTNEREGGKSERPILMPIDSELRQLLIRYLEIRTPNEDSYLFVNDSNGNELTTKCINRRMWIPVFDDEFPETSDYRAVRSHFARHRFVTHWMKDVGINPVLLAYMRGDESNHYTNFELGSIDDYIHTYLDDVRDDYLSDIYYFNVT